MIRREVWLLPGPGAHRTHRDDRLGALHLGVLGAEQHVVGAGRLRDGPDRHHMLVGNVAVGKHTVIDLELFDQPAQVLFGIDGNAVGVEFPRELGRVLSAFDVGDLGGREGHHIVILVPPVVHVEVVEVSSCRTDDDHILPCHYLLRFVGFEYVFCVRGHELLDDFGSRLAGNRLLDIFKLTDDAPVSGLLDKAQHRLDFRPHRAGGEMPLIYIPLHLRQP